MNERMRFDRRRLLQSATAMVVSGLAKPSSGEEAGKLRESNSVVDTHVYIGQWPHAYLPDVDPATFASTLRRQNVMQALVGSFDGLFHKDIAGVNERLGEYCQSIGGDFLIPFGSVNPTLPDWEDDVRRCHEQHHMPGVRLHPNNHGYTLADARFTRLLHLANGRQLIVQIVTSLDDTPHRWLSAKPASVDLNPLARAVANLAELRVMVTAGPGILDAESFEELRSLNQLTFDFGLLHGNKWNSSVAELAKANRIVIGSAMPLHSLEVAMARLRQTTLSGDERDSIERETATHLLEHPSALIN